MFKNYQNYQTCKIEDTEQNHILYYVRNKQYNVIFLQIGPKTKIILKSQIDNWHDTLCTKLLPNILFRYKEISYLGQGFLIKID